MYVIIFPEFVNVLYSMQHGWDKIKTELGNKIETDNTVQASCDGCWKCENGQVIRNKKKKIRIDPITMQETTADNSNSVVVDDWIPADGYTGTKNDIEYVITEESGITQNDIDEQAKKGHIDFGNGMTTFRFNDKKCTILVCKTKPTKPQIDSVLAEIINPHDELIGIEE